MQLVVVIQEHDEFPRAIRDGSVRCGRDPTALVRQTPAGSAVRRPPFRAGTAAPVGPTIRRRYAQLPVGIVLRRDRVDATAEMIEVRVEGWQDHRDDRLRLAAPEAAARPPQTASTSAARASPARRRIPARSAARRTPPTTRRGSHRLDGQRWRRERRASREQRILRAGFGTRSRRSRVLTIRGRRATSGRGTSVRHGTRTPSQTAQTSSTGVRSSRQHHPTTAISLRGSETTGSDRCRTYRFQASPAQVAAS